MNSWNLFREMETLRHEMETLFGDAQQQSERGAFLPGIGARRYPRVNLNEDSGNFYISALLPGIDAKALDINLTGTTLTLSGERVANSAEKARWQRQERGHGKFMRAIELPLEVDAKKISAEYADGILQIVLPKAETAKPKQISVKVK